MTYGEYVPARIGGLSKPNPPPPLIQIFRFVIDTVFYFIFALEIYTHIGKNFPKNNFWRVEIILKVKCKHINEVS